MAGLAAATVVALPAASAAASPLSGPPLHGGPAGAPLGAHLLGDPAGAPLGAHLLGDPAGYSAASDGYSLYNVTLGTGAQAYWRAGFTGQGVGVALVDSGVSQVPGLDSGNVVYGPDLSFDSQSPSLADLDSFGHGTHMAGIIAGRDTGAAFPYAGESTQFAGMAPDAHVVSVKVADTYGDTDVTQIIAAIDWVVQHRDDPGLNIRVLNLSLGVTPTQPYQIDPLAYAVEQAWDHGIVVVVAAGNDGNGAKKGPGSGLEDPAYDPNILAVGAADTRGTVDTHDDTVAGFSSTQGSGKEGDRKPDLVSPGAHIAGLRDPGSWIDTSLGSTATVGDRFFRGSGTSQAAAVVSGAAALLVSEHPGATPDQIKALLMQATDHLPKADPGQQGNGELDLAKALGRPLPKDAPPPPGPHATGTGSLQADRSDGSLVDAGGSAISGNEDIFGAPVDTAELARAEASGTAWSGGDFNGNTWSGHTWSGNTWSGHTWSAADWAGHTWSSDDWTGHTWSGHTWSGNTWSGNTWSGNTWSGNTWSGNTWSGNTWSGSCWDSGAWL